MDQCYACNYYSYHPHHLQYLGLQPDLLLTTNHTRSDSRATNKHYERFRIIDLPVRRAMDSEDIAEQLSLSENFEADVKVRSLTSGA